MSNYDYVIIGGGPSGLTLSLLFQSIGKKCIIIERENTLGGCHRVTRKENKYFTEHGPRIYSSSYVCTKEILKLIDYDFDKNFVPYNFSISQINNQTIFNILTFSEFISFAIYFLLFLLNINKDISMHDFMTNNKFSKQTYDFIERVCRLTDGGTTTNYSINKFFQLINQQIFYTLYQPKKPNDVGLFNQWEKKLNKTTILKNTIVNKINILNNKIISISTSTSNNKRLITGNKYIFCIPPISLLTNLENSKIYDAYGDFNLFKKWVYDTNYIPYIFISFHWNNDVLQNTKRKWGFPSSQLGLAYIIISDYMMSTNANTIISTCITFPELTKDLSDDMIIENSFKQLKESYPNLPKYDKVFLNRKSKDSAYIETVNTKLLPYKSFIYDNLYNCGTQNGSFYKFTSMESTIYSSINLANDLEPKTIQIIKPKTMFTLQQLLLIVIVIIGIYIKYKLS